MVKKYILTGGPSSGKTSIILDLEQKGEYVVRECAEDIIKTKKARGIDCPWNEPDFQDCVLDLQIMRENIVEQYEKRVFMDRGIPDQLAYHQKLNLEQTEKLQNALIGIEKRYESKVFLIENLGRCETNSIRREKNEEALELEKLLEQNYVELGYDIVRIAPAPIGVRVQKILDELDIRQ